MIARALRALMLAVIVAYKRAVAPFLPPACRFYPSCSAYGYEAIARFGPARGGWLTVKRVCRCHPFHPGGFDPVPGSELDDGAQAPWLRAAGEESRSGAAPR